MTYQLATFYCDRCRAGTPHEHDRETGKSSCTICTTKKREFPPPTKRDAETVLQAHLNALDGMGNRGPTTHEPRRNR